jgi:hypothetical protein
LYLQENQRAIKLTAVAATQRLLVGESGVMVGLHGRDIGAVSLEDATSKRPMT